MGARVTPCVAALAGLLVGVLAGGCAAFPEPDLGICGNRIVEANEDCDHPDPERCEACHLTCTPNVSRTGCPEDRECGQDGLCRAPSGEVNPVPVTIDRVGAVWLGSGDIDGDHRDDIVVQLSAPDLEIAHVSPSISVVHLADSAGLAAVGDIDGDDRDEILVGHATAIETPPSAARGLSMFREETRDGTMRVAFEVSFATLRTSDAEARLLSVTPVRDRVLEIVSPAITRAWSSHSQDAVALEPTVDADATSLGRSIAAADLDDAGTCAGDPNEFPELEVALAAAGATAVGIQSTCGGAVPFELATLPSVGLPAGDRLGDAGTFLADANGDAPVDLFVQNELGAVLVAYGVGDGTFHSDAAVPIAAGDGRFAAVPWWAPTEHPGTLVAVADFDDDGLVDAVTTERFVAEPPSCATACSHTWPTALEHAIAVDINGDDALDVVGVFGTTLAVHLAQPDLEAGSVVFLEHEEELLGPAHSLAIGDFDRDTVDDVAFLEHRDEAPTTADEYVTVMFGGEARSFQRMGPFSRTQALAVERDDTLVVRTKDGADRPAGAFMRPDAEGHDFGFGARQPELVRTPAGIVAVTLGVHEGEPEERLHHLGLADGTLSPHDVVAGAALPGLVSGSGATAIAVAIDLDGADVDELVVLGNTTEGGTVWIAELDPESGAWSVRDLFHVPHPFARRPLGSTAPGPGSAIAIGDADGDGDVDVVATTDTPALPQLVVLRNDDGVLSADATIALESPSIRLFGPALVEPWYVGESGAMRWFVAGDDENGVADIDLVAAEVRIGAVFGPHAEAFTTADTDGDGLLDAIVATKEQIRIYHAEDLIGG